MGTKLMGTYVEASAREDRIDLEFTINGERTLEISGSVVEIRDLISMLNRAINASVELSGNARHDHYEDGK